jgi:hypothetical protein
VRGETAGSKDKAGILVTYREAVASSAREFEPGASYAGARRQPDMIDAWLTAAAACSRMGRTNEALDAFREAIRRKPDRRVRSLARRRFSPR